MIYLLSLVTFNIEHLVMAIHLDYYHIFMEEKLELELREDIDTVLEENMVVSMEPMIMIPEGKPGAGRIQRA